MMNGVNSKQTGMDLSFLTQKRENTENERKTNKVRKRLSVLLSKKSAELINTSAESCLRERCASQCAEDINSEVMCELLDKKSVVLHNEEQNSRKRRHSRIKDIKTDSEEEENAYINKLKSVVRCDETLKKCEESSSCCDSGSEMGSFLELEERKDAFKFMKWNNSVALGKIFELRKLPDYERVKTLLNTDKNTRDRLKTKSAKSSRLFAPFWNSTAYVAKEIEKCVYQNDWINVTKLLLSLTDASPKHYNFLRRVALMNFICNPTAQKHELLEDFLKECYSSRSDEDVERILTSVFHVENKLVRDEAQEEES